MKVLTLPIYTIEELNPLLKKTLLDEYRLEWDCNYFDGVIIDELLKKEIYFTVEGVPIENIDIPKYRVKYRSRYYYQLRNSQGETYSGNRMYFHRGLNKIWRRLSSLKKFIENNKIPDNCQIIKTQTIVLESKILELNNIK